MTREQMATFLYRYAKLQQADTSASVALTGFPDGASVSPWAKDAMQWAVGSGLIQGTMMGPTILWALPPGRRLQ